MTAGLLSGELCSSSSVRCLLPYIIFVHVVSKIFNDTLQLFYCWGLKSQQMSHSLRPEREIKRRQVWRVRRPMVLCSPWNDHVSKFRFQKLEALFSYMRASSILLVPVTTSRSYTFNTWPYRTFKHLLEIHGGCDRALEPNHWQDSSVDHTLSLTIVSSQFLVLVWSYVTSVEMSTLNTRTVEGYRWRFCSQHGRRWCKEDDSARKKSRALRSASWRGGHFQYLLYVSCNLCKYFSRVFRCI